MFFKALFTGWKLSQVSDPQRAEIGRKGYQRLRAIGSVIAWESEWGWEDGEIRTRQHGIGDWRYWDCDITPQDFEKLITANQSYPLDTLEYLTYDDCPQCYEMDGRRVSFRPIFNVTYRRKGTAIDLGAITA